jgi:hypothetical protein
MSALSTAANVLNAQQSTGPKTPEGKEHSKFNALKTGIYARSILLPDEDQAAFDAIGSYLTASLEPQNEEERNLVTTIQNTNWRLQRIVELEFSLYAIESHKQLDAVDAQFGAQAPHARQALARAAAFAANLKAFEQISRQEGRLQRALDRAQRELLARIDLRPQFLAAQPQPPTSTPTPIDPFLAPRATPTGFVPSKYPADMPDFTGQPHMSEKRRRWLRQNGYKTLN